MEERLECTDAHAQMAKEVRKKVKEGKKAAEEAKKEANMAKKEAIVKKRWVDDDLYHLGKSF